MSSLLRVENLSKYFIQNGQKILVLDNINISIHSGEIFGIAGESGSGKSTLARCIAGLHNKDAGNVYFSNHVLPAAYTAADFKQHAGHIQMIFQDPLSSLNPRLTIGDILTEPLHLNTSLSASGKLSRVQSSLLRMGLQVEDMSRYPHSFSGGQLQRIGIARALINQPTLLICDEPISALDVSVQAQIINLLKDLRDELGLTLMFIGHDLAVMRYLCDRIAVMYQGKIVEQGDAIEVLDRPQHSYTQKLVQASFHL